MTPKKSQPNQKIEFRYRFKNLPSTLLYFPPATSGRKPKPKKITNHRSRIRNCTIAARPWGYPRTPRGDELNRASIQQRYSGVNAECDGSGTRTCDDGTEREKREAPAEKQKVGYHKHDGSQSASASVLRKSTT